MKHVGELVFRNRNFSHAFIFQLKVATIFFRFFLEVTIRRMHNFYQGWKKCISCIFNRKTGNWITDHSPPTRSWAGTWVWWRKVGQVWFRVEIIFWTRHRWVIIRRIILMKWVISIFAICVAEWFIDVTTKILMIDKGLTSGVVNNFKRRTSVPISIRNLLAAKTLSFQSRPWIILLLSFLSHSKFMNIEWPASFPKFTVIYKLTVLNWKGHSQVRKYSHKSIYLHRLLF